MSGEWQDRLLGSLGDEQILHPFPGCRKRPSYQMLRTPSLRMIVTDVTDDLECIKPGFKNATKKGRRAGTNVGVELSVR